MIHIGIDIHKSSSTFCALQDDGKIVKRGKVSTSQESFTELAEVFPGAEISIAIETGNFEPLRYCRRLHYLRGWSS